MNWWREGTPEARRALIAAFFGWMLDAFDVMLYALVLVAVMKDLNLTKGQAGIVASLMLVASAAGGMIFGIIADRYGRTRALMGSILIYSIFTGACGLAQSVTQLILFRMLLGLGMGGEWASGASLVSETWPAQHRGKALGFVQSAWAVGYAAAAIVTAIILPRWGWRVVFFVGMIPAFVTLWIQRTVKEPEIWRQRQMDAKQSQTRFRDIFRGPLASLTVTITIMNACTMFAWWGFNQWIPAYLSLPTAQGGVGLTTSVMSGLVIAMQVGMWFGYVTFGFMSDSVGRRRSYVLYLILAAALITAYVATKNPVVLLVLGPFTAFFATGYFTGFGAITAEIYPTEIRAAAQGFTYNIGRIASAVAPFAVGSLAQSHGFPAALSITAVAFLLAAIMWIWIPETRGKALE